MSELTGRPQDQGRRHRRTARPSEATRSLLARYQAAMRDELESVLDELRGPEPAPGLALDGQAPERKRPPLAERMRLWELGIKLGRELGSDVDVHPLAADSSAAPTIARPRRRRVDFG